jgi:tetratricopeptide (TPR) repeat protein
MEEVTFKQSRVLLAQTTLLEAFQTKDDADIDAALIEWISISNQIPSGHTDHHHILASLAIAHLLRWRARKVFEDLKRAISLLVQAISVQEPTPCRALYENYVNLGAAYMSQWEHLPQDPSDIIKALDAWEKAYKISLQIGRSDESVGLSVFCLESTYSFRRHT